MMTKLFSLNTLFLLFAIFTTANAQSHLKRDADVRVGKLANGMAYYIRHNSQTPGQADFYLANRTGSVLEEPQQRGLAHFLEHMAFNGTEHFPYGNGEAGSIRNWCEGKGIKFGNDLNASTSIDNTTFNISNAPISKDGVADTCLLILRDWSGSLLLRDDEIDKERGVIREEWRSRRSMFATTRMMEDAMPVIYKGSKYEDCLPIGHIEVIDTFHYETLREYYRKWYRPDLQAVIVVGDIDVDSMEAKIKALFSDARMPENPCERIYYPVPDNKDMIVFTLADKEQPTLNFSLYMKRNAERYDNRDTREAFIDGYKSRMAMFILKQRLSELTKQSPIKLLATSCRDRSFYVTKEKDAFALTVSLLPENPKAGIDAAIEVVEKARRYGFTEAELGHAKDQHMVDVEHKRDNKTKTRNSEYVHQIIDAFCNGEPLLDADYRAALEAEMAESITLADVNEAVKEIITNKNQVCVVFGPEYYGTESVDDTVSDASAQVRKPFVMPSETQFKEWIESAQQKEYANDALTEQVDFTFMKKLPKKGKIIAMRESTNGYREYLLSNGIHVHMRPSKIEPNRVMVNMFRLGGRSLMPEEDAATMSLMGAVIRESGAADFDYLTLEKKRRGKALRVVPYINTEEEGVNGVCVAGDFKTWLEICHLYLTQPRKDETIFNSIMERQRTLLSNRTVNPNVAYKDSLRLLIYGKNKRTEPMTLERLNEVDFNRMYEIYNERFKDLSGMNLIVTGDVREEEFDELICQYVASLPGKKPSKDIVKAFCNDDSVMITGVVGDGALDVRKGKDTRIFHLERKTPSAWTNIVFSTDIPYTADNDLKIDVLAQILRTVYTEKVREEKGGTYGVTVESQSWKYPTEGVSLTISFRCATENYEVLLPIIDQQIALMAEQGPTEQQLMQIKEYELKNYERAILTNGWWEYVRYHELHDGVNFDERYTEKVNALTTDDIKDLCKALLSSGNRLQVTMK